LEVIDNNTRSRRDIKDVGGDGLISIMKSIKPKLAICITVYNETRSQLEKTILGIYSDLKTFKTNGISPFEILVIVIYDGIEKLNVEGGTDESMIQMFQ